MYEEAQKLGLKVRIVESDGTELIVIKRKDLSTEDEKRKLLALADNHTSDTSEFDWKLVIENFSPDVLNDWEFSVDEIELSTDILNFDYGKIAEFYAHSNNIIQNLMENSALVIIDFNKAIELGYVCLKKELSDSYLEDYSNDEK